MKIKAIRWPILASLAGAIAVGFLFQNCAHKVVPNTTNEEIPYNSADAIVDKAEGQGFSIAAGGGHTCAINKKGQVYCWGKNRHGLAGGPLSANEVLVPQLIEGLENVVQLAPGTDTNCALTRGGEVFCWGSNSNWGFGRQGAISGPTPIKVMEGVKYLDGDYHHFCAVMNAGNVKCWGNSGAVASIANSATPEEVSGLTNVEKVNVGFNHACAILKGGRVKCWGAPNYKIVENAAEVENVVSMDAGLTHTCALKTDGSVMCWGANNFGQTGGPLNQTVTDPTIVPLSAPARKIVTGAYTSCALLNDGTVSCWGNNVLGQFGLASTQPRISAKPETAIGIREAIDLTMGADHVCVVLRTRRVSCWGVNAQGQLGNGSLALGFSASPIEVPGLPRL